LAYPFYFVPLFFHHLFNNYNAHAHLIADGESAEGGGLVILGVVVASGYQSVALQKNNQLIDRT